MVGNKGKGSRSKPKALKPESLEPEPEPLKMSLDDSSVASDGDNGMYGILVGTKIPTAEEHEQMVELTSGFLVSDEEKDQYAVEDNDDERDVVTENNVNTTEDICTQEGTIDDVKEVSDGDHAGTDLNAKDNEERNRTDNPEGNEALMKTDNNDVSEEFESELTTKDVSANNEVLDFDHVLVENLTNNIENHKEQSELDIVEPVGTTDKEVEENANITNEVKVVTDQVSTPKKKVVKKKLVKKKVVRKNAVNKEMPQPSGDACDVDANNMHANDVEKASDLIDASVGECKTDNNEHIKDAQKPQSENDVAINEPGLKNDEVENSGGKTSLLKKRKKKKIAKKGSQEVGPKDENKPKKGKSSKKVDSMGMIFMCNSETKKDCYRYNVLGLPPTKKDMVLKIYKGMRLFLFDVDLRMMYGIYKAAGPGGYNIEPNAFKSQYPSQVRFSVLKDCVPLAEEKFREVLKDNYYAKKKFNFQLNNEQVKNLCKLFQVTSKKAESTKATFQPREISRRAESSKKPIKTRVTNKRPESSNKKPESSNKRPGSSKAATKNRRPPAASSSARRDNKKRKRADDTRTARAPPLEPERTRRRAHEEIRLAPVVISDRYLEHPTYQRETYVPSVAPVPMYQTLRAPHTPPRTYTYDRVSTLEPYRRETVIDPRDLAPSTRDSRRPIERSYYDSYVSYREAPRAYSGQTYSSGTGREHYDYAEYFRTAEYRPPPPLYRRY